MTIIELLNNVLAGGVLGVLGQGVRIAVGLKKLHDSNTAKVAQDAAPEPFSPGRLLVSLFVGFVAGAIGMLVKNPTKATGGDLSTEAIVTIIAVGYSGADFIEGLFNTYIQKFNTPTPAVAMVAAAQPVVAAQPVIAAQPVLVAPDLEHRVPVVPRTVVDNVITPGRPVPVMVAPGMAVADVSNSAEHDR